MTWVKKLSIRNIILLVSVLVIALLLPTLLSIFNGSAYLLNVVNYIFVYAIATAGLNVMTGYSGQINLGGAAYFSVGAYGTVILSNTGLPMILCVVLAMLIVILFGFLTAVPAAKLKFHFLALATMAVGEIVNNFIKVSPGGITNDTSGLFVKALNIFGLKLSTDGKLYYFLLLMTVVSTVVSCLLLGFAGFLFAYLNRYISPDTFAAGKSTMFMSMMMLGGAGTLAGPILGAVLVTLVMEVLRGIPGSGAYLQMSYGIILLIIMMFLPQGLSGLIQEQRFKRAKKQMESQGGTPHAEG